MAVHRDEIIDIIVAASHFYRAELDRTDLTIYADDLENFSVAQIEDAIRRHRREPEDGKFMPKPAHIIGQIRKNKDVQKLAPLQSYTELMHPDVHSREIVTSERRQEIIKEIFGDADPPSTLMSALQGSA